MLQTSEFNKNKNKKATVQNLINHIAKVQRDQ